MFNSKSISVTSAVLAVGLGMAYSANTQFVRAQAETTGCTTAFTQRVQSQGGELEACIVSKPYIVTLENYEQAKGDLDGLTVSIYDLRGNRIAFQSQFGDHPLEFKASGSKVLMKLYDTGDPMAPGILFRPFLEPNTGLFTSLAYDPGSRSLSIVGKLPTDPGSIPTLDDEGIVRLKSSRYNIDGVLVHWISEYQFAGGKFTRISESKREAAGH